MFTFFMLWLVVECDAMLISWSCSRRWLNKSWCCWCFVAVCWWWRRIEVKWCWSARLILLKKFVVLKRSWCALLAALMMNEEGDEIGFYLCKMKSASSVVFCEIVVVVGTGVKFTNSADFWNLLLQSYSITNAMRLWRNNREEGCFYNNRSVIIDDFANSAFF